MNINRRKFLRMGSISVVVSLISVFAHGIKSRSQQLSGDLVERFRRMSQEAEAREPDGGWVNAQVLRANGGYT